MDHIAQGNKHLDDNNPSEALEVFDLLLKENSNSVEAYLGKGIALRRLERREESHKVFDQALEAFPENAEILGEKGVTFFQENQLEDALAFFVKAVKSEPENAFRYSSLAFAQAKAGFLFEAMDNYERSIELDPENEITHNNLGLLKEQIGWNKDAQVHFKKSDDLIGRTTPEAKPKPSQKSRPGEPETSKKVGDKKKESVLGIFSSLFTSGEERRSFFRFWKEKLSGPEDK